MTVERIVMAFAGSVVLLSVALAYYVHPYFIFLTLFVGANLLQAAFTKLCPLAIILKKMGFKNGTCF